MQGLSDIFSLWPTNKSMAEAVGVKPDTVRKWKKYRRIPSDSWSAVVAAVNASGGEVSLAQLLTFNAPMKPRGRPTRKRRSRAKNGDREARA
jgi:uncharacterized protein YjcR